MSITYSKDKMGDGYLLRGLEAELVEGERVDVTLKSGATKSETVGPRRAGPFADGMVLHEKAGGAGRAAAPKNCQHCGGDLSKSASPSAPATNGDIPF